MKEVVFDTESDGLAYEATKLHVLAYTEDGENITVTHDVGEMKEFFSQTGVLFIAHNSIRHDMPLVNRVLDLQLNYKQFVDTLALSWYLNFDRDRHGLEHYGIQYNVPKPVIKDWHNLTPDDYANRVREDVKINWLLWLELKRKLKLLYG